MKSISKFFGTFKALNGVNLNVRKKTIHALLGENGAGKSTLMNILYGLYEADEGEIYLDGKLAYIKNPNVAIKYGIGMVHQHFMLVENFTIAQNIMLGKESVKAFDVIDTAVVKEKIKELGEKYGMIVDGDAKICDVSVSTQQKVEILKSLYRGAQTLILDEPTAVLTPNEIDELIDTMHKLTQDGKTVIIITHKLKEIIKSADYCTIIRRGNYIDTVDVKDKGVDEYSLAKMMVGRDVSLHISKTPAQPKERVFEICDLWVKDSRGIDRVKNLSLNVRAGEILGIAGIDGNGQSELIEALTGLTKADGGKILIKGKQVQNTPPHNIRANSIATIPEDRHKYGLVLDFDICENLILEKYAAPKFADRLLLKLKNIFDNAKTLIHKFDIRPADCEHSLARSLSGGNQQKVVIAREIENDPVLLVAVQPTRGLDVGAIEFVHKSLIAQRDKGKAVLLVSFELDEILDVSDRINVIYDGKIVGDLDPSKTNENEVGLLMAGGSVK
ncbi:MAG: ABC transporter ATP-binding protein [Elusimicrobiota bacterium]|nr:ABC transporter ATP-binding protein [Elusimicrobiota bacterium]